MTFAPSPGNECTDDLAPTTHVFELPAGLAKHRITVDVVDQVTNETHALSLDSQR